MGKIAHKSSTIIENDFFLFQDNIATAEKYITDLADYLYVHSSLKPMSKVIFFISRIFLILKEYREIDLKNKALILQKFELIKQKYKFHEEDSDYSFNKILVSIEQGYDRVISNIKEIYSLTEGTDSLGLIFNTLIRGRFEAGEGLGTHLTPEEIVRPVTKMCLSILKENKNRNSDILVGDITSGTGRFPFALIQEFSHEKKFFNNSINYLLADQSNLSIELAKINFIINNYKEGGVFLNVTDSLIDERLIEYKGKFSVICTNPPFGSNKYFWDSEIMKFFPKSFLEFISFNSLNHTIDPAELFLFKNLDLLEDKGILGIVLPDGIIYSDRLKTSISFYENLIGMNIIVKAVISLPVSTFSLGGTVAKTSFLILQKVKKISGKDLTYVAEVKNIGFLKKGNIRIPDPKGNDLENISNEFINQKEGYGKWKKIINCNALSPSIFSIQNNFESNKEFVRIKEIASIVKDHDKLKNKRDHQNHFHISILDINAVGIIDLIQVKNNNPITAGLKCLPGDILISCINPKIWRVTVVPDFIDANWTCSSEFAVIRLNDKSSDPYKIFFSLMEKNAIEQVKSLAKGTSSSRQRVKKDDILNVWIRKNLNKNIDLDKFKENRKNLYQSVWSEILTSVSFFGSSND